LNQKTGEFEMNTTRSIAIVVILAALGAGAYIYTSGGGSDSTAATGMEINFGNNSYDALAKIEISPAGQGSYMALALQEGNLGAGNFSKNMIENGNTVCKYDLKFTKENGDVADRMGVDLCAATFYHFEDDG